MPVLPAILPLLISENGYSYLTAGLLVTAYNLTSSFTQPLVGWLSDTKGFSVRIEAGGAAEMNNIQHSTFNIQRSTATHSQGTII